MKLNEKIKERRILLGLTQDQLSKKAGISDISVWETGKIKPMLSTLIKLAAALECDVGYLLGE